MGGVESVLESPRFSPDLLSPEEIRILGALIEKEATTPEYYPMTANGLTAACNQKSNRFPVTEYSENDILSVLHDLRAKGLASERTGGSRVPKYGQRFTERLNLGRRETAILCVLMLRGQQTIGEIKGRTDRLYGFTDLDEVELVLQKLKSREGGALVQKLAPAPGMKEPRWAQTLGGLQTSSSGDEGVAAAHAAPTSSRANDRLSALESEVANLQAEVAELRRLLESVM